jgi:hypothetical protein
VLPHDGRPHDSAETKPTTFEALILVEAMSGALCEVTPSEAAGWFDHCGYEVEVQYVCMLLCEDYRSAVTVSRGNLKVSVLLPCRCLNGLLTPLGRSVHWS